MKFKFNLEKVLKHRNILSDLAQRDFLEALSILNNEIKKLESMKQMKTDSLKQRSETVQGSQTWAASVEQINQFLTGQDLRIKIQNQRLHEMEKGVEDLREILRKSMIEVKIIEKLKEKKFEEFKANENRKEQNEMDELSVLRFSRIESLIKGSHEDGI